MHVSLGRESIAKIPNRGVSTKISKFTSMQSLNMIIMNYQTLNWCCTKVSSCRKQDTKVRIGPHISSDRKSHVVQIGWRWDWRKRIGGCRSEVRSLTRREITRRADAGGTRRKVTGRAHARDTSWHWVWHRKFFLCLIHWSRFVFLVRWYFLLFHTSVLEPRFHLFFRKTQAAT